MMRMGWDKGRKILEVISWELPKREAISIPSSACKASTQ